MTKDLKKWATQQYLAMLPAWTKIRDCFDGEDAVKGKGEVYLPKLKNQDSDGYNSYLLRALFFPITGKTCSSMVGLVTSKPPKVEKPDLLEPYFVDTNQDFQFTEFYISIFTEVTLQGRYGVLIDAAEDGSPMPDLCPYTAENIMKWTLDKSGKCVSLILREIREVSGKERFETDCETVLRHCFLGTDGKYWVEELDDDLEVSKPAVQPTFMGQAIDFIPFVVFGSSGVHWTVDKPPMQDISTLNLSHYLSSADLEWGRHIVGLPTPVVSGVDSQTSLHIGGTAAWILPAAESKAYYLEFQGQGLGSLEKALTDKVSLMASVSARMIDNSVRGSEAAETVRLRYLSESATLVQIVNSVQNGMMMLYNMLSDLMKAGGNVTIEFSKDIIGTGVTFADMSVMFTAYLNGSISKETLVYNLRRLDALDPDRTDAQEMAAILPPHPPAATTPPTKITGEPKEV